MESRNTKQRLEELCDLLQAKYITESEFRVARANILREGGFDLTVHPAHEHDDAPEEEFFDDPEPKGRGCGCFLIALLLAMLVVAGAFFLVSEWTGGFEGQYARVMREEILRLWDAVFPPEKEGAAPIPVPVMPANSDSDDVASQDERTSLVPEIPNNTNGSVPEERSSPPGIPNPVSPEILPSALPGESVSPKEPEITIVEIPSTLSLPFAGIQGVISANSARIRSAPDTSDTTNVVGWGRRGDHFSVLEQGADKSGAAWYRVRFDRSGREGWISGSLVQLEQ
jgi:hypothetical protein